MMQKQLLLLLFIASVAHAQAPEEQTAVELDTGPQTLSELMDIVREGTATRQAELQAREQRFLEARDERAELLRVATENREREEAEADRLRVLYEQGEEELADLEDQLAEQSGDLTEVFAVVTQVASDAVPLVQNSMVSAQYPGRLPLLESLTESQTIPTAEEMRELWLLLMDEMIRSGEVARFEVPIITSGGEEQTQAVTRIGTFSAISEGEYLRFLPESGRLLALARQPVNIAASSASAFEVAREPIETVALDPSRGSILSLIVQTPELSDRIRQGGVIGYIILAIGVVGLLLGMERIIVLGVASRKARMAASDKNIEHPINQLKQIAHQPEYLADVDAMSALMDEIVAVAAQSLRRGLPTLAIFAAVSPLLGLLGTVTGMIETFQVITLFGAGDPRLMSGGISQALITTQLGLAVAIPLLLIHSFLQGRANNLIASLDETAADQFAKGRAEEGGHA